jgi:hypothetical protein
MLKTGNIVALFVLGAGIAASQQAFAADPCEKLQDKVLFVDGNGFEGSTNNYSGLKLNRA